MSLLRIAYFPVYFPAVAEMPQVGKRFVLTITWELTPDKNRRPEESLGGSGIPPITAVIARRTNHWLAVGLGR